MPEKIPGSFGFSSTVHQVPPAQRDRLVRGIKGQDILEVGETVACSKVGGEELASGDVLKKEKWVDGRGLLLVASSRDLDPRDLHAECSDKVCLFKFAVVNMLQYVSVISEVTDEFSVSFKNLPKGSRKFNIKPFNMDARDREIQRALHDWRRVEAPKILGISIVQTYGAQLLLADEIIDRIVGCIRMNKINTVAQLAKETGWRTKWVEAHGESLLAAVGITSELRPASIESDRVHITNAPELSTSKRADGSGKAAPNGFLLTIEPNDGTCSQA